MSKKMLRSDPLEGRLARIASRLAEHEPRPSLPPAVRFAMTAGPILGFGIFLLIAYMGFGPGAAGLLAAAEVGSFVGAGKFVIFAGIPQNSPVSVWALAAIVVYGDMGTALIMMANMMLLYRIPFVGKRLLAAQGAAWHVLRGHTWMRRLAWLGVALFVAVPFQGTGAAVGTILARLLGLSRLATLSSTAFGSCVGCAALALLGSYGRSKAQELAMHPVAIAVVLGLTIVTTILAGRWFLGKSQQFNKDNGSLHDHEPR